MSRKTKKTAGKYKRFLENSGGKSDPTCKRACSSPPPRVFSGSIHLQPRANLQTLPNQASRRTRAERAKPEARKPTHQGSRGARSENPHGQHLRARRGSRRRTPESSNPRFRRVPQGICGFRGGISRGLVFWWTRRWWGSR